MSERNKHIEDISSSSILNLKAEILRRREETQDGIKRTSAASPIGERKRTVPSCLNEGSKQVARAVDADEAQAWEKSRRVLEEKAAKYDQLQNGQIPVMAMARETEYLVDFDRKGWDEKEEKYVGSTDPLAHRPKSSLEFIESLYPLPRSNSRGVDGPVGDLVEYTDEFGRTRKIKREEYVKMEAEREETKSILEKFMGQQDGPGGEDGSQSDSGPLHYEADREIRAKGVGFFTFSKDETERQRQLKALNELRNSTVESRMKSLILKEEKRLKIASRLARAREIRKKMEENRKEMPIADEQDLQ